MTLKSAQSKDNLRGFSPFRSDIEFNKNLEEYEKYELIRRTCRESANNIDIEIEFRQSKNNFLNRMMLDKYKRDNRDKTFEGIQTLVALKTDLDHDSIGRIVSPRRERIQCHNHTHNEFHS